MKEFKGVRPGIRQISRQYKRNARSFLNKLKIGNGFISAMRVDCGRNK